MAAIEAYPMTELIEVEAEPVGRGIWFQGPDRSVAWSPLGDLSSALSYVVARHVAVHPWDQWPNPKDERQDVCPPLRARTAPKRKTRSPRERRPHV